jgi:hypothetical protein
LAVRLRSGAGAGRDGGRLPQPRAARRRRRRLARVRGDRRPRAAAGCRRRPRRHRTQHLAREVTRARSGLRGSVR